MDAILSADISEECIISDMITLIGGFHTSGYFLTWLFYYLARHPDIQERVVEDIQKNVKNGSREQLKAYIFSSSSYLRQVIDEALRLSTIGVFSHHYDNEDLVVDGYHIPAETPIIHAIGVTMMNEAIWEDPKTFNPDRFAPGSQFSGRKHEFRPFGIPLARRCPANLFTYAMVSVFLSILLQHFIISVVGEHETETEKSYGVAAGPKEDITIEVQYRQKET